MPDQPSHNSTNSRQIQDTDYVDINGEIWPELALRFQETIITRRLIIRSSVNGKPIKVSGKQEEIYSKGLRDGKLVGEQRERKKISTDFEKLRTKVIQIIESFKSEKISNEIETLMTKFLIDLKDPDSTT